MKHFLILLFSIFIFSGCITKYNQNLDNTSILSNKVDKLAKQIQSLSNSINKDESEDFAFNAITHSKYLARKYDVVGPALFHNTLINMNIKQRGLCYHYANDLLKFLSKKRYKSFKLIRAVSNKNEYFEHTSIVLLTENTEFKNGIVLDAWRNTGELFFSKVKNDTRYKWEIK